MSANENPATDSPATDSPATDSPATDSPATDSPATWENVVVGKAKELLGHATKDDALVEEGAEQEHIAHEVRADHDARPEE